MIKRVRWTVVAVVLAAAHGWALGQSSSLLVSGDPPPKEPRKEIDSGDQNNNMPPMSASIAAVSWTAVHKPPPHGFAVHDLITIVVNEDTKANVTTDMDTEHQGNVNAQLANMPRIGAMQAFMKAVGGPNLLTDPTMALTYDNKFQGTGTYDREDVMTTRVTARIIDVKPNGTLVLEGRKYLRSDKEELNIILTGTCRKQDVASDNTILSTQLYDLHLDKQHTGEMHNAATKGFLTKFFEFIFNF